MNPLHDELFSGPLSAELAPLIAARQDADIVEVLNRRDIQSYGTVSVNEFAIWAASTGVRTAIQDHADNLTSPLRSIALTLLDLLSGNLDRNIDFGNAANVTMLEAWVYAGVIDTTQRNQLLTMSAKLVSRADLIGGVSLLQVSNLLNAGG